MWTETEGNETIADIHVKNNATRKARKAARKDRKKTKREERKINP